MDKPRAGEQSAVESSSSLFDNQAWISAEGDRTEDHEQATSRAKQPRLMTPAEDSTWGPILDLRRESAMNRARFDPALLAQYRGELIAWSPDGTKIIAHAKDDETVYRLLEEVGGDPSLCLVEYIGDDDIEV